MAPPHRSNVKDVAALAKVSVGTVSNVLNRPELVSVATRERVESAMADLNFHRNAAARNLRAGVSSTVGAIVSDVSNPFYTELLRGIEDRLAADDHTLIMCSSDNNPEREASFLRLLTEQGVRGVLITPMDATASRLTALGQLGIPSVLLDADIPGRPSVGVDNVHGGREAVSHLLEMGHRRIAILAGQEVLQPSQQRCQGAIEAVQAAALDPAEVLQIVHLSDMSANGGQQELIPLLDSSRPPTAVFAINDIVALGVLRELRVRGLRVPEDVAVVGYDDLFLAAELMVPLSSVRQPMRAMGWAAADLLLSGNPHPPFVPELIVRASSSLVRSASV
jgi:LacI family transcriptional regulator